MTNRRMQQIITSAIAETDFESWKYYHVCWWEGRLQCLHVHHTKEHHPSFFAACGHVFTEGLNPFQWKLLIGRVEDFCRSRGITLRSGLWQRARRAAGSSAVKVQITEFDSVRLRDLIAGIRAPGAPANTHLDKLERVLESARTVVPAEIAEDVVTMNSQVRLKDSRRDEEMTCSLVFPLDSLKGNDLDPKSVSILSPIGTSILGRRVGDTIAGRIRVDQMLYQPEAAGDFHL
jgi:regulator of nucleoside diphosphate kinase